MYFVDVCAWWLGILRKQINFAAYSLFIFQKLLDSIYFQ